MLAGHYAEKGLDEARFNGLLNEWGFINEM